MEEPKDVEAVAVDSPLPWARDHTRQYLESDGAEVDHPRAPAMVLLYTKGRSTGLIRRVPLVATHLGEDLVVMASKGGAPTHPEWYLNLVADPTVWVRDRDDVYQATATTLAGDERSALWGQFVGEFPVFQEYADKTERVIPLVRLTREA